MVTSVCTIDDIPIFGTKLDLIKEVKDFLSRCFEMKDLGVANVILNIKLLRDENGGITLLQSHYVEKVLSRFGYSDCNPSPTPYMLVCCFEGIDGLLEIN